MPTEFLKCPECGSEKSFYVRRARATVQLARDGFPPTLCLNEEIEYTASSMCECGNCANVAAVKHYRKYYKDYRKQGGKRAKY